MNNSVYIIIFVLLNLAIAKISGDHIDLPDYDTENYDNEPIQGDDETEDEKRLWADEALLDVAFYLRAHKFNEFDRRYYLKMNENNSYFFAQFPIPPLVTFHWEVFEKCSKSIFICLKYLHNVISETSFQRESSTNHLMRQMNWTMENHSEYIHMVDNECLRLKKLDWTRPNPFRGPLERFRWRVTASYFMCWYTMQNISLLSMFNEPCDDIGECYQSKSLDFRSDNSIPYQCALYSFCPDPCCPIRRVVNPRDCDIKNPCRFAINNKCTFHRHQNLELPSVIYNEWNVSCICDTGYLWDSRYGMCIDVNECSDGLQKCDDKSETCINLPGSYKCICRWGYMWIDDEQSCVVDISVKNAEIRFGLRNVPSIQKSESISIYSNFWNYLKNIYQKFTIFNLWPQIKFYFELL